MRKPGIALAILVLVAGCADSAGPDTTPESVLPGTVVAPLVIASADVRDRLLPALAESTRAAAIDDALGELQVALATGLPTPMAEATATLRAALDAAASSDPPALGRPGCDPAPGLHPRARPGWSRLVTPLTRVTA